MSVCVIVHVSIYTNIYACKGLIYRCLLCASRTAVHNLPWVVIVRRGEREKASTIINGAVPRARRHGHGIN